MTDQDVLRKALNQIDSLRYRAGWMFGVAAALSQTAWIVLGIFAEGASEKGLILLATFALAGTVFGGVFLLVLVIYRMTHKLLQAIELSGRRA
jgi:hypothetical protein